MCQPCGAKSCYVLTLQVEMQLLQPIGGVPLNVIQRRSPRLVHVVQAVRGEQTHAEPPDLLWEIPAGNERLILDGCC